MISDSIKKKKKKKKKEQTEYQNPHLIFFLNEKTHKWQTLSNIF